MAGYHSDSQVFSGLVEGNAHVASYEINSNAYGNPYYLADEIHPD
jgi:nitrogen fixation protein FixH